MPRATIVSLIAAAALTGVFALIAREVVGRERLPEFDRVFARDMAEVTEEHDFRRLAMIFFTIMGGIPAMTALAVVGGIWQWRRHEKTLALAWVAIVLGGGLLTLAGKALFDRDRPPAELRDPFVHETNESFPSGHSMGAMIGYGVLAYAVMLSVHRRRVKALILTALALWVGMIGFSRMYLRAHWFSDVIAGFIIGLAWLEFCLAWVEWGRTRNGEREASAP
jgi:membrane-associated phospholipid phosphatase